jgi:uncharacterized coiled-coil protein SlyX
VIPLSKVQANNPASTKNENKNMTTLHLTNSMNRAPWCRALLLIPLALAWFWFSPTARALNPPPDGDYFNENTAEGEHALFHLISGNGNTAIGFDALFSNTNGGFNTATGFSALSSNTTGGYNTANGTNALESNTTGFENTANGFEALLHNNADFNTASGALALRNNTTGGNNTATGFEALRNNTTGSFNTANGDGALFHNTTGGNNTATGVDALYSNTSGSFNTANGDSALFNNTTGGNNTANGVDALYSNTSGSNNTANGLIALFNNTTGGDNIAFGVLAGANLTKGSNNIDIGNLGVGGESRKIRIGTAGTQNGTFIAGIRGVTTVNANAVPVVIDSAGQLGTTSSSRRFKKEIKPMDQTSEAILGLKPVTFQYKSDSTGTPQFGLIAEEVAKVNPDLVVRDEKGEIYTVRYEAVNAMLLNEFLKEHRTVQGLKSTATTQEATITQLKSTVAQQQKEFDSKIARQQRQIEGLTAGLQEVSAQVDMSRAAPQMVLNNQ